MRKKNRSFLLMSLISASLLVSVSTIVQARSPAAMFTIKTPARGLASNEVISAVGI